MAVLVLVASIFVAAPAWSQCGDGVLDPKSEACDDGNAASNDGCSSLCTIEVGYVCPVAGSLCVVMEDCAAANCDVNATCSNSKGPAVCSCNAGYAGDGIQCSPACGDGLIVATETCDDGNAASGDGCSASCQMEPGFTCPTPGVACSDIDECATGANNCAAQAVCTNTPGSFTCACNAGYTGDGVTCTDIDECATGADNCAAQAVCTNTPGSFTCACNTGYTGDGVTCTDVDECAGGTDNCAAQAVCTNTPGSFTCACNTGYTGDGVTCTDVDECATGTDNCAAQAVCTNTAGSFTCACNSGYTGDGATCTDIDECATGTDNCAVQAVCTNTPGSFDCACNTGYTGDGVTCTDVDECAAGTDNCAAAAVCTNTPGSFSCACNAGYTGDGMTCTDVDECATGTDNCAAAATCTNSIGGFQCACPVGYVGDGTLCAFFDDYLVYRVSARKSGGDALGFSSKLPKGWTILIDDLLLANSDSDDPENYEARQAGLLLNPAVSELASVAIRPTRHYLRYRLKDAQDGAGAQLANGSFPRTARHLRRLWRLQNRFGTINVESSKVKALLVPAAISTASPPAPGNGGTSFLCYAVRPTRDVTDQTPDPFATGRGAFRRTLQIVLQDEFDDCAVTGGTGPTFPGTPAEGRCLFDLGRPLELCNPAATGLVVPPRKTAAQGLAPSVPEAPESLLCYRAGSARAVRSQEIADLVGASVGDPVTRFVHQRRRVKTGNPVYAEPDGGFPRPKLLDTIRERLICLPTDVTAVTPLS